MWTTYLLLFVSSGCVMTLELVAGRLLAPHVGTSLYTWTGIIGACLSGMSLGYLFGGWLADRANPRKWLGRFFLITAAFFASLLLAQPFMGLVIPGFERLNLSPAFGIFLLSVVLFGTPCFFLAAISPLVYKMTLTNAERVGTTVGRMSAAGMAGSIAGTYLTGFWLIPTFGTRTILMGIAGLMTMTGAFTLTSSPVRRAVTAALLIGVPYQLWSLIPPEFRNACDVESAYYCISVKTTSPSSGKGPVKKLFLDYLVHSGYRVDHPEELWYEYEQVVAWILQARGQTDAKTLFLGGGGYILPHWVEKRYPQASVEVVELDPAVTSVALAEFVPKAERITTYHSDARMALTRFPSAKKYDIVVSDVFSDLSVPYHLTTVEFARLTKSHLSPNGIYIVNVVDWNRNGSFVGAMATSLRAAFPHVTVLPGTDGQTQRGPHLLVASSTPIPWKDWEQHPSKPRFDVSPVAIGGNHPILTDDYAPTDSLLLSVFADRWQD